MSVLLSIFGISKTSNFASIRAARKAELEQLNMVVGPYMSTKK